MLKPLLSEFLASFLISFMMAFARINNHNDYFIIGLTYFMLIGCLTYSFKKISGSHFNPILTFSLLITKQISSKKAVLYIFVQVLGSIIGGILVYSAHQILNEGETVYYGEPRLTESERYTGAFTELISMFVLVYVYNGIIGNVKAPKHIYGAAIASVYLFSVISFGFVSGGCVNLVSLFGPSIFSGHFIDWFPYLVSQLLGGVVSGTFYTLFLSKNATDDDDEEETEMINNADKEKAY